MRLAFDEHTPPGGARQNLTPVVLLHGRLDSRGTWKTLGPRIAEKTGRTVYAYDARNHGDSPWSTEMDFEILVKDLKQFLEDRAIQKAVLVGHSMGGKTALTFSLQEPEVVEKLIVEDMVVENYSPKAKDYVLKFSAVLRKSIEVIPTDADEREAKKAVYDYIKSLLPPGSTMGFMYAGSPDIVPLKRVGKGYSWKANLDVLEDMLKNRTSQTLSGKYEKDALFLYGGKSFFDVGGDESISKHFPRAMKICIEEAGHLIHQDFPEDFLREVLQFI